MSRFRGFTLIELMIVTAIIGILSAIAVPMIARYFADEAELAEKTTPPAETAPAAAPPVDPFAALAGTMPEVAGLDIEIALSTGHQLDGIRVHTWYEAVLSGVFTFRVPEGPVKLGFPFPTGTAGARGVALELRGADGEFSEPPGVIYDLQGIYWSGTPPAGETLTARVAYRARGYDRFVYHLPGAGRTPSVQVKLRAAEGDLLHIPGTALQPTTVSAGEFGWAFENLVTQQRDIVVDLPAVMSPMGRVLLLAKLAGIAVLLFGAGFWYMSEARDPGRLDRFRWGHFLLLALTYFLFFLIFAVLMFRYHTSPATGLLVAGVLSLPLLILHVAFNLGGRLGPRFALTHVLPLAVFTLGLVINGVYGGRYREYLYVAAAVVIMAYFTLTYRQWSNARYNHRRERRQSATRRDKYQRAQSVLAELADFRKNRRLEKTVARLAEDRDPGRQGPRRSVETARDEFTRLLTQSETLAGRLTEIGKGDADLQAIDTWLEEAADVHKRLKETDTQLTKSLGALMNRRDSDRKQNEKTRNERENALRQALRQLQRTLGNAEDLSLEAELAEAEDDPENAAVVRHRQVLKTLLTEREDFAAAVAQLADLSDDNAHLARCQALQTAMLRLDKQLLAALAGLGSALQQWQTHRQRQHKTDTHCLACGKPVQPGEFCLHCGAPQAKQLACQYCGEVYPLPRHLLALWPPPRVLYCPGCGKQYEGGG